MWKNKKGPDRRDPLLAAHSQEELVGGSLNFLADKLKRLAVFCVQFHLILDRLVCVDDGAVIASAEMEADRL